MHTVENGMYVSVDYKGTLDNGNVFDTSQGRQPLEVHMGSGQLLGGFESQLIGMSVNEKKVFSLSPENAYGMRDDSLIHAFPIKEVPPEMDPEEGQTVALTTPDGRQIPARIVKVDDQEVKVDLNHPLAGQRLTFEIEVVGISETPTQTHEGCGSGCNCSGGGNEGHGCSSGCH
jgi:peptidylprolyl isomerase